MLVTPEDFAGAEREFRADLSMALALFKRYPESADIHRGLAVAHERLGYALGRERHWSEARQEYQAELDILTPLVAGDPGDFQWRMDRALSEEGLGDVALGESRAETAIARYRDYAGIMTEAMKDFTPDDRMRRYLAIAYQRLGDALLRIGRSDEGRGYLEQCAAVGALAGGYDARNAEPGDVTGYCRAALARSAR
jgi:tetratricopeptide (TPR) repeat protein